MLRELEDFDETYLISCPTCAGSGAIEIGDVENGVLDVCPECHGEGEIEEGIEVFIPERDALKPEA